METRFVTQATKQLSNKQKTMPPSTGGHRADDTYQKPAVCPFSH